MKRPSFFTAALLAGIIFCAAAPSVRASDVGVTLHKINTTTAKDRPKPDPKKKPPAPEVERAKMDIVLQNQTTKDLKGLKVTFFFLSRNLDTHEPGIELQGDLTADLPPNGTKTLTTKEVSASTTAAYTDKAKHIRASGKKLIGVAAQVFQGTTLIGEAYSPDDMKAVINPRTAGSQ